MDIEEREHLMALRKERLRRLRILELREAREGYDMPAGEVIEIHDLRGILAEIDIKLSNFTDNTIYPEQSQDSLKTKKVEIILKDELRNWKPETKEAAIRAFAAIMGIPVDQIKIVSITLGSIKILLEVPAESAETISDLFQANDPIFQELGIIKVKLAEDAIEVKNQETETADVIVIGGGVNGASTLFHLAQAGVKDVVLVEQGYLAAGATGKSGGLVRMHYTNPHETRLAYESLKVFQNWDALVGGDCGYTATGFVQVVAPAHEQDLRAYVAMQRAIGVNAQVISAQELHELEPDCRTDDLTYVAYEPDSGYADPIKTCFGFVRRAQELGARVKTHTTVTGVRHAHGRVIGVNTSDGPIDAPNVVFAGGAWSNRLLGTLGIDLGLMPNRLQVVVFRWPITVGRGHMTFIDAINDTWFRPEHGNGTLIGAEWIASEDSPDSYRETADPAAVASARERLVARFPVMTEAPMRGGWAGMVMMSPDGRPIIDQVAGIDGLFVMVGDSGTSFKTSPAIGKCLTEWITEGQPRTADLRPFRASRFSEDNPWSDIPTYGRTRRTVSR